MERESFIQKQKRNLKIFKDFENGMLYSEIGRKYDLETERIRQIITENFSSSQIKEIKSTRYLKNKNYKKLFNLCNRLKRLPSAQELQKSKISPYILEKYKKRLLLTFISYAGSKHKVKKVALIEKLKTLSIQLKKTPSANDLNKIPAYESSLYQHYFGTLRKAQKLAGLKPNKSLRKW